MFDDGACSKDDPETWEALDCSFGFRPGRRAHDALRVLDRAVHRGAVNWILEADIQDYFGSVDRKALLEMFQIRVADGSMLRLVGKCRP